MSNPVFVGRDKQLTELKRLFKKKTASLVVIRGRRRIGKSRLIEQFAAGCTNFYSFSGLAPTKKTTAEMQREEFARQMTEKVGFPKLKAEDWGDLFTSLATLVAKQQTVILLDEITWMGSLDPTFLGKLKIAWDEYFKKNPKLILILCGSISSWIDKNIISSTDFFGRISHKVFLEELSLINSNKMLTAMGFKGSLMEKFMILSLTGGVPWYLELINPVLSAVENIRKLCFEKEGILVDEYNAIFHDLFGKRSEIYKRIVERLALGPAEYKEISNSLNYPSGGPLSEYLEELCLSGYISRDHTWLIKSGKKRDLFKYRLRDNYLRFYLKYIGPNYNRIQRGAFEQQSITALPGWNSMLGFQFENLVLNNRRLILVELAINQADILYDNPYFQHKTTKQQACQIDYLIQTRFNTLYVCEIKFSKEKITTKVISEVKEKIKRLTLPRGFSCIPVLVHVNGVSESVLDEDYFAYTVSFVELLKDVT